jgi:hypothetical protein
MKEFAMPSRTKMPPRMSRRDAANRSPPNQSPQSKSPRGNKPGNAKASHDRYVALARAAASAGDKIEAENMYQHAEHYCRLMRQGIDGHPVSGDGSEEATVSARRVHA